MITKTKKITALIAASLCATSCYLLKSTPNELNVLKSQLVLAAIYGKPTNYVDITEKIKNMVKQNGKISIPANMNSFAGGDPIKGIKKETRLYILENDGNVKIIKTPEGSTTTFNFSQTTANEIYTALKEENKFKSMTKYSKESQDIYREIINIYGEERNILYSLENTEIKTDPLVKAKEIAKIKEKTHNQLKELHSKYLDAAIISNSLRPFVENRKISMPRNPFLTM